MDIERKGPDMLLTATRKDLGVVVHPGDRGWDAARGTFNLLIDQRPEAIAFPADEREAAAVIADARERGLRVAAQATGHNPAPLGSLEGTLILNTSALTGVSIDAAARRVRVGAATRWEAVVPRLSELGLAALHGSSPKVGIVGYSLGGGIGWLAPQARHADERGDRDRAGHRRGPPRPRRRGARARAVLGPARRRRQLRHRDRDRVRGSAGARALRRRDVLRPRADRRRPPRVDGAAAGPSRGDHLVGQRPALPAAAGDAGGGSRTLVRRRHGRVPRGRGRRARAAATAARRSARRWTRSRSSRRSALGELAMDPPDPLPYRTTHALLDESAPAAIEGVAQVAGPGSALDPGAAPAHGRRPRPPRAGARARARRSPARSACSASAWCPARTRSRR